MHAVYVNIHTCSTPTQSHCIGISCTLIAVIIRAKSDSPHIDVPVVLWCQEFCRNSLLLYMYIIPARYMNRPNEKWQWKNLIQIERDKCVCGCVVIPDINSQ